MTCHTKKHTYKKKHKTLKTLKTGRRKKKPLNQTIYSGDLLHNGGDKNNIDIKKVSTYKDKCFLTNTYK